MICEDCGAHSRGDAEWCGQCLRPFRSTGVSHLPTPAPQRHIPVATLPQPVTYSRWRKGPTSFGPVGRVSWTVGVLLVAGLCIFSQDWFAIGGWCLIGAPLVLRSVWAKARIA